jgi:uncharacterized protein HemX
MGTTKAGNAAAIMSTLATVATAATQVARMAKATETTVGVAKRARNKISEDDRILLGLILGALGLGLIVGFLMGRSRNGAGEPDASATESTRPELVANATDSTDPSTEASG